VRQCATLTLGESKKELKATSREGKDIVRKYGGSFSFPVGYPGVFIERGTWSSPKNEAGGHQGRKLRLELALHPIEEKKNVPTSKRQKERGPGFASGGGFWGEEKGAVALHLRRQNILIYLDL